MKSNDTDEAGGRFGPVAIRALAVGAQSIGAIAAGAFAIGAVTLGVVAIGRLVVGARQNQTPRNRRAKSNSPARHRIDGDAAAIARQRIVEALVSSAFCRFGI